MGKAWEARNIVVVGFHPIFADKLNNTLQSSKRYNTNRITLTVSLYWLIKSPNKRDTHRNLVCVWPLSTIRVFYESVNKQTHIMPRVKAIKMLRSVDKNENTNVTFNQTTPSAHNHNNSDNNGQGTLKFHSLHTKLFNNEI